jgi:antitoxin MazE
MYAVQSSSVAKWGTSLGVRLPKRIAESLKVREGDKIKFQMQDGMVTISKNKRNRTIDELFEGYKGSYPAEFVDYGPAKGNEVDV